MTSVAPEPITVPGQVDDEVVALITPASESSTVMQNNQTSDDEPTKPEAITTDDALNKLRDLLSTNTDASQEKTIKQFPLDEKGMDEQPQF